MIAAIYAWKAPDSEALVSCGFRIGEPTLFMASRPFGRPELYLPSGPVLYYVRL